MSMTMEEIIQEYEEAVVASGLAAAAGNEEAAKSYELFKAGLDALRPVSREQVEKMRGEWTTDGVCSRCGFDAMYYKGVPVQVCTNYCPACGSPMTDEAVETIMKRMEEMRND